MTRLSFALLALVACNHSDTVLQGTDGNPGSGSDEMGSDGTCSVAPWQYPDPDQIEPAWVTMSCPSGGCPGGTTCVYYQVDVAVAPLGCAPTPSACDGTANCACMGCICGGISTCADDVGELTCETPTD
jgi:hypothetical protein